MKKLCTETPENEVVSKILVENVEATRAAILKELFDLPSDTTLDTIVNTPVRLPKLEVKPISEKRLKSIKKKYKVIPKEHIPYYPGGDEYLLHATNAAEEESDDDAPDSPVSLDKPKKKVGRPKAKVPKNNICTPSILNFFKALPVISKTVDGKKLEQKLLTLPLTGDSQIPSSRRPGLTRDAAKDFIDCNSGSSGDESEVDSAYNVGRTLPGRTCSMTS